MKSTLLIAALFAATTASAQSALTLPNNSAGTELDTPPLVPPAAKPLEPLPSRSDPAARVFDSIDGTRRGYVTREDVEQMQDRAGFDAADANHDGRLDADEFQRYWDAPDKAK